MSDLPRCIGFGEREGICENTAAARDPYLWCDECERARRGHLNNQFAEISALMRRDDGGEP